MKKLFYEYFKKGSFILEWRDEISLSKRLLIMLIIQSPFFIWYLSSYAF